MDLKTVGVIIHMETGWSYTAKGPRATGPTWKFYFTPKSKDAARVAERFGSRSCQCVPLAHTRAAMVLQLQHTQSVKKSACPLIAPTDNVGANTRVRVG